MLRKMLLTLAASALLLAACGSDKKDSSDTTTTAQSETTVDEAVTTTTAPADSLVLESKVMNATFTESSCSTSNPTSVTIEGQTEVDGTQISLSVLALDNGGTISVFRDQETASYLDGTLSSVEVLETGEITIAGTFADDTEFTLAGRCTTTTETPTSTTTTSKPKGTSTTTSSTTTSTTKPATTTTGTGPTTTTTTTPSGPTGGTVKVDSTIFSKSFTVRVCVNPNDTTLAFTAITKDGYRLSVSAKDGAGSMSITGGTGSDAVKIHGSVTSVEVDSSGAMTVEGVMGNGTDTPADYTITGSCAAS